MTGLDDIRDRIERLEASYGLADGAGGGGVSVIMPPGAVEYGDVPEVTVDVEDIVVWHDEEVNGDQIEWREVVTPHHRPACYRGPGVKLITELEVAWCWQEMPDDVRDRELEMRLEAGDPIPPVLQR